MRPADQVPSHAGSSIISQHPETPSRQPIGATTHKLIYLQNGLL